MLCSQGFDGLREDYCFSTFEKNIYNSFIKRSFCDRFTNESNLSCSFTDL